jgi:hypothetical protein
MWKGFDMAKEKLGNVFLAVGTAVGLLVLLPLSLHLSEIHRSPTPNSAAGLTVLENCHGTHCYVSQLDSLLEDALIVAAPITVLLIGFGSYLASRR